MILDFGSFDSSVEIRVADGEVVGAANGQLFIQTFQNMERYGGTVFDDVIIGSGSNGTIRGDDGAETIKGGAGDNDILGGFGNDFALYDGGSRRFKIRQDETLDEKFTIDRTGA
ncbi:MAG: hypothetical protein AAF755_01215 [Pseudomonadota bacterium]